MTILLGNIIDQCAYTLEEQKIALMKLAAYRGCFGEEYKNKLIENTKAEEFLKKSFDSFEEGLNWWSVTIDNSWLRKSFQNESFKNSDPTLNVARWDVDAKAVDNHEERELLSLLEQLKLVHAVAWPKEKVSHVIIHGAIEKFAQERVNFLEDFSGTLVVMTSPRGLFNDEPSLAPILAGWLVEEKTIENIQKAIEIIQSVLDQHRDLKKSNKNWLKDLRGLKDEILQALKVLNITRWSTDKGAYHKNPEPFNKTAEDEKREAPADWPSSIDMVEYLLKQKQIVHPGKFKDVKLYPIYSVRPGRVATTEHNIEDWYDAFGRFLPKSPSPIVFVSNNSKGAHYIDYQHVITMETLQRLERSPGELTSRIHTVGAGATEIGLSAATDTLARIFFAKKQGFELRALQKYFEEDLVTNRPLDDSRKSYIDSLLAKYKVADLQGFKSKYLGIKEVTLQTGFSQGSPRMFAKIQDEFKPSTVEPPPAVRAPSI